MFASLQSFGSSPVSSEHCIMICRMVARCSAHSLSMRFGMLSGPEVFLSSFSSPFWSIVNGVILILARILVVGRLVSDVIVNTDLNCSSRSSAFPLLSLTRSVPFLMVLFLLSPGVWI